MEFHQYSYLMNGPLTFGLVVIGSIFNVITVYVISNFALRPKKIMSTARRRSTHAHAYSSSYGNGNIEEDLETEKLNKDPNNNIPSERRGAIAQRSASLVQYRLPSKPSIRPSIRTHSTVTSSSPTPMPSSAYKKSKSSVGGIKTRVYTFLVWLAVSDTLLLGSSAFMYSLPTLLPPLFRSTMLLRLLQWAAYPMGNATMLASVWMVLALIVDRWVIVSRPFTKNRSRSNIGIHLRALGLCIMALVVSMPRALELSIVEQQPLDAVNGSSYIYKLRPTTLADNRMYIFGYRVVGGLAMNSVAPFSLIFVCLWKVWAVMYKANSLASSRILLKPATDIISKISGQYCPIRRWVRKRLHSDETTDSEIILMFITQKILIARLLPTSLDFIELWMGRTEVDRSNQLRFMSDLSNFVVVGSAAVNFFIFIIFSSTFRRTFFRMLGCGW